MTTKQSILRVLDRLPENASERQILEAIQIRLCFDEGVRQCERGESLTMAEFEQEFAQWLR